MDWQLEAAVRATVSIAVLLYPDAGHGFEERFNHSTHLGM
jgi:hypothetical protein